MMVSAKPGKETGSKRPVIDLLISKSAKSASQQRYVQPRLHTSDRSLDGKIESRHDCKKRFFFNDSMKTFFKTLHLCSQVL